MASDKVEYGWDDEEPASQGALAADEREGLTQARVLALTPTVKDEAYWVLDSDFFDAITRWMQALPSAELFEDVDFVGEQPQEGISSIDTYLRRPRSPGWTGKHTPAAVDYDNLGGEDEQGVGEDWERRSDNALFQHEGKRLEKALLRAKRAEKKRKEPESTYFADYGLKPAPYNVQGWNASSVRPAIHHDHGWGPPAPVTAPFAPLRRPSAQEERTESAASVVSKGKARQVDDFWAKKAQETVKVEQPSKRDLKWFSNDKQNRGTAAQEQREGNSRMAAAAEQRKAWQTPQVPSKETQSVSWPSEQLASKASSAVDAYWQPRAPQKVQRSSVRTHHSAGAPQARREAGFTGRSHHPGRGFVDLDAWLVHDATPLRYHLLAQRDALPKEQIYQLFCEERERYRWNPNDRRCNNFPENTADPEFPFPPIKKESDVGRPPLSGVPPRQRIVTQQRTAGRGRFDAELPLPPAKKRLMHASTQTLEPRKHIGLSLFQQAVRRAQNY